MSAFYWVHDKDNRFGLSAFGCNNVSVLRGVSHALLG